MFRYIKFKLWLENIMLYFGLVDVFYLGYWGIVIDLGFFYNIFYLSYFNVGLVGMLMKISRFLWRIMFYNVINN